MDRIKNFFTRLRPDKDCDISDRVTYYYTVLLLIIFAFIIFGWSLFGTPIQCWFPAQYKGWWIEYALDYCYVQNTYFVKFNEGKPQNHWELDRQRVELPMEHGERSQTTIGYYQWVPFVLALMAISFFMPIAFWHAMYEHSGISVRTLCEQAGNVENTSNAERRQGTAKRMAQYLDHSKSVCERFRYTTLHGRYVITVYLISKVLSLAICVGQFFVLEQFLGLKESLWGVKVLSDIRHGREWTETGNFPRVTQCDYKVREMGSVHHHTVQCVLLINMLNEKFFVFLWFWFAFVAALSACSLLNWLFYAVVPNIGRQYIYGYLKHVDPILANNDKHDHMVDDFIHRTLKADGVFLIRLISHNSGDLICSQLVAAMWNNYLTTRKVDRDKKQPDPSSVKLVDEKPAAYPAPNPSFYNRATAPRADRSNGPTNYDNEMNNYPPLPPYEDVKNLKRRPAPPPPAKP